jgi:broad specificity phosphatase PhoE
MALEVDLYRHGHTPSNDKKHIVMGQNLGVPLDTQGEGQALSLGEFQEETVFGRIWYPFLRPPGP